MSQNHRPAAPAIDLTKKSSLFEVPLYAYLAGIIDIHGFISISRRKSDGGYATRIGLSDISPIIPNLAFAIFAGRVYQSSPRQATYHAFYMWEATHQQAREPLVARVTRTEGTVSSA